MSLLGFLGHICVPNRSLRIRNDEDNLATYCAWLKSLPRAREVRCAALEDALRPLVGLPETFLPAPP